MLFSSQPFLFFFLPLVLILYYFLRANRARNVLLFFCSIFFYAWGEPWFALIMFFSIVVNWRLGLWCVRRYEGDKRARIALMTAITFNVALLFVFKYLGFVLHNSAMLFASSSDWTIALPIGISFFTFQEISYVIDSYTGKAKPFRNLLDTGLYVAFFPQLIAGPIIRFETFCDQLTKRRENWDQFIAGSILFIVGLSKKVLLADTMARIADAAFDLPPGELSPAFAWLGALGYTFQIYFDFSGYSDMAIGLARMFGFEFPKNFNYPYISGSISDFWRRWHISLGTFFRDYIYFPLGGSKVASRWRLVFNLFVVWALTGFWHGANWTFILWGLYFFVFIALEKIYRPDDMPRWTMVLRWPMTFFLVVIGWVLFRATSLTQTLEYLQSMFTQSDWLADERFLQYLCDFRGELLIAALASLPLVPLVQRIWPKQSLLADLVRYGVLLAMLLLAIGKIESSSFSPFIYFNF